VRIHPLHTAKGPAFRYGLHHAPRIVGAKLSRHRDGCNRPRRSL